MIYPTLFLIAGLILCLTSLLFARSWRAAVTVLTAFLITFGAVLSSAGWPVNALPPDRSVVVFVFGEHVWAVPPDETTPRAYVITDHDLIRQVREEFLGRLDETGKPVNSPMVWFYDKEGGKGKALLPYEDARSKE